MTTEEIEISNSEEIIDESANTESMGEETNIEEVFEVIEYFPN
jgi:hypothetical protein